MSASATERADIARYATRSASVRGSMERVLEPEVMDTAEEAADYDAMDHGAVNERFCADLLAARELSGKVLDVGTGTALIPIALCKRTPHVQVVAIDLAVHMLALAKRNVDASGLADRIELIKVDAKGLPFDDGEFPAVVSNSIVHHIPEPRSVLAEMLRVTAPGGLVFVRDLFRPPTDAEVDRLVHLYGGEPPLDEGQRGSFDHQRMLFRDSLKAALTLDEVRALAKDAGMPGARVSMTSDRHWTLLHEKASHDGG
ncbi:MAG: class I SAM-dependent methyltransferase [Labilithrix sp.]|nr:class I SAM-dependent methyltransferase [Labilithrix sp.]MCW5810403.1 class I SAM-dependent methyltransferase [Labilithrix sp.]